MDVMIRDIARESARREIVLETKKKTKNKKRKTKNEMAKDMTI
jgi:hypothetical protein